MSVREMLENFAPPPGHHVKPMRQSVVTVGRKDENGQPVDNDRFFVMSAAADHTLQLRTRAGKSYTAEARSHHPDFDPRGYPMIRGILMKAEIDDALVLQRSMYRSPKLGMPPDKRPVCSSKDFVTATRWEGGEWRSIPCPGDMCRFTEEKECKPGATLAFVLNLPDSPQLMTYWATKSPQNVTRIRAWLNEVDYQFKALGQEPRWWGIKILLTLESRTSQKEAGRRYPLVDINIDGAIMDSIAFAMKARDIAKRIGEIPTARLLSATFEQEDADQLSGTSRPIVLTRPVSLETVPEWPPLAFVAGVSLSPSGEPTCPLCSAEMGKIRNRAGSPGWVCSTRPACAGARRWDGSAI